MRSANILHLSIWSISILIIFAFDMLLYLGKIWSNSRKQKDFELLNETKNLGIEDSSEFEQILNERPVYQIEPINNKIKKGFIIFFVCTIFPILEAIQTNQNFADFKLTGFSVLPLIVGAISMEIYQKYIKS